MTKALLKAVPFDIAALRMNLCVPELGLCWDVIPERASEHTVDVDLE